MKDKLVSLLIFLLLRAEILKINVVVNGSGDTLAGLEEARWNYEAAKGPKELVVIESVNQDPKRMEEAIANHIFHGKEKETIEKTSWWLRGEVVS